MTVRAALLVVDLQNEFFAPDSPALASLTSAVEHVNAAIAAFRRAKHPVIVIEDVEEPGRVEGSEPFLTHASLAVEAEDHHVAKRFGNAFWRTTLEEHLRSAKIDTLVVAGFCAEHCILSTYRGALERGFRVALLQRGIASPSAENLALVERLCDAISVSMLEALIA